MNEKFDSGFLVENYISYLTFRQFLLTRTVLVAVTLVTLSRQANRPCICTTKDSGSSDVYTLFIQQVRSRSTGTFITLVHIRKFYKKYKTLFSSIQLLFRRSNRSVKRRHHYAKDGGKKFLQRCIAFYNRIPIGS